MMAYMLFPLNSMPVVPIYQGGAGASMAMTTTGNNTTHAVVRGT